jgi:hypothetical protein
MFQTIKNTIPKDQDYPERQFRLSVLTRVLRGQLYDTLEHDFHEEKGENQEYIPLRQRRPSVRYGLCKMVVDDSVSLLFSEGHFPKIDAGKEGETVRTQLTKLIKETSLNEIMIDAAMRGSVGSVAILFRVLQNRVFFNVMDSAYLTPIWQKDAPDTLEKVVEQYKVKGKALKDLGYPVKDDDRTVDFWFRREWTGAEETWFDPLKVSDAKENRVFVRDAARSVTHNLGFVPVVWVKNLPGGDEIDGACTFPDEVIDTSIEIDYQLSQAGRGLKYSSDPTLLLKEPANSDGPMVRSASNAIVVDKEGDAKLLEINGSAVSAVIEYVRALREMALETAHGNRSNADKVSAAQSGRAMELMNAPLIRLADQLRISYGEGALLSLLNMVVAASKKLPLIFKDGTKLGSLETKAPIALRWAAWFPPTAEDLVQMATALKGMIDAGILSRQTAIKMIAAAFDIEDTEAEFKLAEAERLEREAGAEKQVKITE